MSLRYFALNADVGLAPPYIRTRAGLDVPNERAGEPEPLREIGVAVPVPVMAGNDVVDDRRRVFIRPAAQRDELLQARIIPGTRVVEVAHPAIANLLIACGQYHEVAPPASEQPRKPRTPKER